MIVWLFALLLDVPIAALIGLMPAEPFAYLWNASYIEVAYVTPITMWAAITIIVSLALVLFSPME